jgi:hypothetical protein
MWAGQAVRQVELPGRMTEGANFCSKNWSMDLPAGVSTRTYTYAGTGYAKT